MRQIRVIEKIKRAVSLPFVLLNPSLFLRNKMNNSEIRIYLSSDYETQVQQEREKEICGILADFGYDVFSEYGLVQNSHGNAKDRDRYMREMLIRSHVLFVVVKKASFSVGFNLGAFYSLKFSPAMFDTGLSANLPIVFYCETQSDLAFAKNVNLADIILIGQDDLASFDEKLRAFSQQ